MIFAASILLALFSNFAPLPHYVQRHITPLHRNSTDLSCFAVVAPAHSSQFTGGVNRAHNDLTNIYIKVGNFASWTSLYTTLQ